VTSTAPERVDCPFCNIVRGLAPATTVRTWPDAIAIVPLRPVTHGHLLVLPRVHVADALADPDVTAAAMRRAAELSIGALNLITSIGSAATQSVYHLHIHIVPRAAGDGLALPWDPPTPQERG
jgi:histidine triad (HIT) family protein